MTTPIAPASAERLASLDAYRGFIMICLAANGFGLFKTSQNFPDSAFWQWIGPQFEHVEWTGCAFWDLIQPSFMFMVGVALPYSVAKRAAGGADAVRRGVHALGRAVTLVLLGVWLSSSGSHTNWSFMNVLSQIGLGYFFLYLLAGRSLWLQEAVAMLLLAGYWAWFAAGPLPPSDFDYAAVGVKEGFPLLHGFEAHWQKNANVAATFDVWLLNLFPRPEPFVFNPGGYQTLNFIPSLATMIFGLMAGEVIRRTTNRTQTFVLLLVTGLFLLGVGWGIAQAGYCPLVKRIWTPSWTLFSTGWTLLFLGGFYGVIDVFGFRAWAFPLVVAGMNSIALYLMSQTLKGQTLANLKRHFGDGWATWADGKYQPLLESCAVLAVFWLIVYWLYRQRAFLKI
jgi:predicted acyltransferase